MSDTSEPCGCGKVRIHRLHDYAWDGDVLHGRDVCEKTSSEDDEGFDPTVDDRLRSLEHLYYQLKLQVEALSRGRVGPSGSGTWSATAAMSEDCEKRFALHGEKGVTVYCTEHGPVDTHPTFEEAEASWQRHVQSQDGEARDDA